MPVGPHVFALLEDALSECFAYHNELDIFILRGGLPRHRLIAARGRAEARRGRWTSAPKRFVVQEILEEIRTGDPDDDRLIASLVTALCRTKFPNSSSKGNEAIDKLKQERTSDSREATERQAALNREREEEQRKKDKSGESASVARQIFRNRFLALCSETDAQERGYKLEKFLNEFMEFEGLSPRASFKIVGEQIDGSFAWSGRVSLVEAKWVNDAVAGAEFGAFDYKIQGKTADTRGLFIAVNGYSPNAIASLNGKGALRFVCIDGAHLLRATEPAWNFSRLLSIVWRHADETGEAYLPVGSARFINSQG